MLFFSVLILTLTRRIAGAHARRSSKVLTDRYTATITFRFFLTEKIAFSIFVGINQIIDRAMRGIYHIIKALAISISHPPRAKTRPTRAMVPPLADKAQSAASHAGAAKKPAAKKRAAPSVDKKKGAKKKVKTPASISMFKQEINDDEEEKDDTVLVEFKVTSCKTYLIEEGDWVGMLVVPMKKDPRTLVKPHCHLERRFLKGRLNQKVQGNRKKGSAI